MIYHYTQKIKPVVVVADIVATIHSLIEGLATIVKEKLCFVVALFVLTLMVKEGGIEELGLEQQII